LPAASRVSPRRANTGCAPTVPAPNPSHTNLTSWRLTAASRLAGAEMV
jgi:hypothetical protein